MTKRPTSPASAAIAGETPPAARKPLPVVTAGEIVIDNLTDATLAITAARAACINVATETLTGDIRDWILQKLKSEQDKRPWHLRSESEQRELVSQVDYQAGDMVRKAVEIIAAGGQPTIKATIKSVVIKDGMKATLNLSRSDPRRHDLADAVGTRVLVIVADADQFTGERAAVEITPDQGDFENSMVTHNDDVADDFADNHGDSPLN